MTENRVPPTIEPTVDVHPQPQVPPEAAMAARTPVNGFPPPSAPGASFEALAAGAAGAQADPSPAEMRVAATAEPAVDLGESAHVPPEAGVVPAAHRNPGS